MESAYWKELLAEVATGLRRVSSPKRLTLRRYETVERDVAIGFFVLRRLIELRQVSSVISRSRVEVLTWPSAGNLGSVIDDHRITDLHDASREEVRAVPPLHACNQVVHAHTAVMVVDETRNWDSFVTAGVYEGHERIWRIPVRGIVKLFRAASKDSPREYRARKRVENIAAEYLEQRDWRIVEQNWQPGPLAAHTGELDIVALDGDTLVIVEVKAARQREFGDPLTWVDARTQAQVARLAEAFVAQCDEPFDAVRFDVIAVDARVRPPRVRHVEDGWRG